MHEATSAKGFLATIAKFNSVLPINRINMTAYLSGHNCSDMMINLAGVRMKFNVETKEHLVAIRWDAIQSIYSIEGGLDLVKVQTLTTAMVERYLNVKQVMPTYELKAIQAAWKDTVFELELRP